MLIVTENARQLLKDILVAESEDPESSLRLSLKPLGGFGIVLDREAEGDRVVEYEGRKVLLVDSELAPMVESITLDVQDTPEGQVLALVMPDK